MALHGRILIAILALASAQAESLEIPDRARVERALLRGSACLVRDRDGQGFRDPYLAYVYQAESLPSPPGGPRLTYRGVDAAAILVSIGRELGTTGELATMVREAGAAVAGAVATWRGRGFSNVREGARPEGIALDTFCSVGWLARDAIMADEAAAALHGDGWLPEALYDSGDRFRLLADESWCLRLLAATGKLGGASARVLERHAAAFRDHARERPLAATTFYEALHLGMVLGEAPLRPSKKALLDNVTAALRNWSAAHARGGRADPRDVLEWANLASADVLRIPSVAAGDDLRGRAVGFVLDLQESDGCWAFPGAGPARAGATFLTLRAVLALAEWRADAGEAKGPR